MIFGIIGFVLGIILGIAIALGFMGLKNFIMGLISPKTSGELII